MNTEIKEKVSLRLHKDGKELFSSSKAGIRPLFECVSEFLGKEEGCVLFDKVVGLAAARLIVYSGFISIVQTPLVSEAAKSYLSSHGILINYACCVNAILDKEKKGTCPMEALASKTGDDSSFYALLKTKFNS